MKLTRRRLHKLISLVKKTRYNGDLVKFLRNFYRTRRLDKEKECKIPYPATIMLELTNICNLHCTTCAREQPEGAAMDKGIMSVERARTIIDELAPYLVSIGLTGLGETFLNPHIGEVAAYIKQRKPATIISCSTNANFPGAVEKILPALQHIDTLQISIDGIGDVYDKIRRGGRFETFVANLDEIMRGKPANVDVMLNMVITKDNYHQLADVVEFSAAHGVRFLNFTYYNLVCAPYDKKYYDFFAGEAFLAERRRAEEAARAQKDMEVTGLDFPGSPSFRKCPFLWEPLYITWDGYLVPCCGKPFPKIKNFGNVFDDGVMAAANSESFCAYRRLWQQNTPPAFCAKCHFIDL